MNSNSFKGLRVLYRYLFVFALLSIARAQAATDVPVYGDALEPDWIAGAWQDATVFNLAQTAVVASGTNAVEVNYTGDGYGGFGFDHRDAGWTFTDLYPNEYVGLSFDINPGASVADMADLGITLDNGSAGSGSFGTLLPGLQANTWLHVDLPMSAIDSTHDRFGRIFFFNNGARHPHFFLDNLVLHREADSTAPVISNVTVGGLYSEGATLTWTTDELSHCVLTYSDGGGAEVTLDEAANAYTVGHNQTLLNLLPNTLYAFHIRAADHQSVNGVSPNESSYDGSFTTPTDSITGDPQVTFTIDPAVDNHPISPYIYGDNFFSAWNTELNLPLGREGGNRASTYNWETNASNAGIDWYNENDNFFTDSDVPGAAIKERVDALRGANAAALITVPLLGYVAGDELGGNEAGDVGLTPDYFNVRLKESLPRKPGGVLSLTPDTTDHEVYQDEFVNWVEHTYFPAGRGVDDLPIFYSLDNEPGLWSSTHPRLHPTAATYAELIQKTVDYASMIKDFAPGALVFGPALYGWNDYVNLQNAVDAGPHGDFIDYYLDMMKAKETELGHRLVDVLDLHWYTEAYAGNDYVGDPYSNDPVVVAARVQVPRSLWDPSFVENSWITSYLNGEAIALIPRMRAKIAEHYPGTKLCFSEYYLGGGNNISGGVTQADALGILGREGVFAATMWRQGHNNDDYFIDAAFRMYRNFDGNGGAFGNTSISALTTDIAGTSVYASTDAAHPGRMVVVVAINKSFDQLLAALHFRSATGYENIGVYRITSVGPTPQPRPNITELSPNEFRYNMPPLSVTTLVFEAAAAEGEGEGEGQSPEIYGTVDADADQHISLSELLRVIQFYNSGGIHCAAPPSSTEDGYAPGAGADHGCVPYVDDYNPQDWSISLSELLRVIQFYNAGGYHYCPASATEDGYCPGAA